MKTALTQILAALKALAHSHVLYINGKCAQCTLSPCVCWAACLPFRLYMRLG